MLLDQGNGLSWQWHECRDALPAEDAYGQPPSRLARSPRVRGGATYRFQLMGVAGCMTRLPGMQMERKSSFTAAQKRGVVVGVNSKQ